MKFCPKCGYELVVRAEGERERLCCPQCGYVYFGTYSIGVGGIVVQNGHVLLVRRAQNPGRGRWTIPGGYIEANELLDVAVVREVLEETGVQTEVEGIVDLRQFIMESDTNVYIVFRLRPIGGEVCADGVEADEAGYFSREEWERLETLAPETCYLITRAVSGSSTGLQRTQPAELNLAGYAMFSLE
jgi:ADP-ribose pyrophosphatase YjhB (NUDIX family)